jgi:hypothetical protein
MAAKKKPVKKISVKKALPKKATAKTKALKKTDAEQVAEFMKKLKHPLQSEIEALRSILKSAHKNIGERIKWNAPSYYYKEDMVTFNPRATEYVHLIFHHPSIEKIKSLLLEGDYKGRRMTYFKSMTDIASGKKELLRVLKELIAYIDK